MPLVNAAAAGVAAPMCEAPPQARVSGILGGEGGSERIGAARVNGDRRSPVSPVLSWSLLRIRFDSIRE